MHDLDLYNDLAFKLDIALDLDHDLDTETLPVTHGCIAAMNAAFYQVRFRLPGHYTSGLMLVEIPMHGGSRPPRVIHLRGMELRDAVSMRRLVVVIPGHLCKGAEVPLADVEAPTTACQAAQSKRVSENSGEAVLAALRRRGLIMTGAEFVRSLATHED